MPFRTIISRSTQWCRMQNRIFSVLFYFHQILLICLHTVKWFQILLCISNNSIKHQPFVYTLLNEQTILFQTIQFNLSFDISIWPIDRTLSDVTTLGLIGSGNDSNEGVLHIPQNPNITGTSLLDCLVSYPGHFLWERSYFPAMMQLIYSTALAEWAYTQNSPRYLRKLLSLRLQLKLKWKTHKKWTIKNVAFKSNH